jgi:3-methylfumaryl-CoA hydratase
MEVRVGEDSTDLTAWVGRHEEHEDHVRPERVAAMAATLDLDEVPSTLPPGWHWVLFNPFVRASELGPDGHPKRGGFLPPVPLPRRMWAGGRLTFHLPIPVGEPVVRRSEIVRVVSKIGRQGPLTFVTVSHVVRHGSTVAVEEEQDLVYRDDPPRDAPAAVPAKPAVAPSELAQQLAPDTTMLFRYSALTSNGHRIHYDQAYAREVEGYPDVVVHGPLTATLLMRYAEAVGGATLRTFEFRGQQPLLVGRPITLDVVADSGEALTVAARSPSSSGMEATATFATTRSRA